MAREHPKHPCADCPYRRDAPLGHWHRDHYESVRESQRNDFAGAMFACHKHGDRAPEDRGLCAGWLLDQKNNGVSSIPLRLRIITDPGVRDAFQSVTSTVPMYKNASAMVAANLHAIDKGARNKIRIHTRAEDTGSRRRRAHAQGPKNKDEDMASKKKTAKKTTKKAAKKKKTAKKTARVAKKATRSTESAKLKSLVVDLQNQVRDLKAKNEFLRAQNDDLTTKHAAAVSKIDEVNLSRVDDSDGAPAEPATVTPAALAVSVTDNGDGTQTVVARSEDRDMREVAGPVDDDSVPDSEPATEDDEVPESDDDGDDDQEDGVAQINDAIGVLSSTAGSMLTLDANAPDGTAVALVEKQEA